MHGQQNVNYYMFWARSAIFRKSTKTKDHKFSIVFNDLHYIECYKIQGYSK